MELRQLVAVVPADLADKVYARAAADGQTITELVADVLTTYVDVDQAPAEPAKPARPRKSTKAAKS